MKKTTCARLAAVAATAGCVMFWGMTPAYALEGTADNHYTVEIREGDIISEDVYGNNGNPVNDDGDITGAVDMTGGTVTGNIYGGRYMESSSDTHRVKNNRVHISGGNVTGNIYGGHGFYGSSSRYYDIDDAVDNTVIITGGTITGNIYGGIYGTAPKREPAPVQSEGVQRNTVILAGGSITGNIHASDRSGITVSQDNQIILTGSADINNSKLYGMGLNTIANAIRNNNLVIDGWQGTTVEEIRGFSNIIFKNIDLSKDSILEVNTLDKRYFAMVDKSKIRIESIKAGDYEEGDYGLLNKAIRWDEEMHTDKNGHYFETIVSDELQAGLSGYYYADRNGGGLWVNEFEDLKVSDADGSDSQVEVSGTVKKTVLTGVYIDETGAAHGNSNKLWYGDETAVETTGLTIEDGLTTNASVITGAYAVKDQMASGGELYIRGNYKGDAVVYAGYSEGGGTDNNHVYIENGAKAGDIDLRGNNKNDGASGATLHVGGNGNTLGSVGRLDVISFTGTALNDAAALSVTDASLEGTTVQVDSLAGGTEYHEGDTVTLLHAENAIASAADSIRVADAIVQAGVAQELTVSASQTNANDIDLTVTSVKLSDQTDLIAENRAVAAAFVNQGADIAAESLDLMSDDYKYGVRTFGAVYGSRSKYDVNSDLKINGWNTIVGVGNVHRKGDANLSWGVFYENGTGNYRTENSFNDEFFRGDGSLVYNGGGAAVRYKKDSGAYYEASLRVGTLNSSMSNAVKDGNGNSYGYDSDSTYWGTHLGIGKLVQSGSGEWNLYGKYFHTEVEGDQFSIAGDEFSFDDVTSDRLRLGARYTADTEKAWNLYYGLAWEYEFNGDSNMKAGQFDAPEQSLQGSTGIAEIGTVWRSDDSPWRADINLKGYTGEREGFSGMVHLTYLF